MDKYGPGGHSGRSETGKQEGLIPKHGGYRKLKSFQIAQLVYDLTVRFCTRYVNKFSRTRDQMVQAARSGVQNIAEGSKASGTSKKTELKLTNVAKASLEELRLDYEDFLRHRGMPVWERTDPRRSELIERRCTGIDEVAEWIKEVHQRGGPDGPSGHNGPGGHCGPPKKSTEFTGSIGSTGSTESTRSIRSIESTKSSGPTKSTGPIGYTEPTAPTKSTGSTKSTGPIGYTEPTAPTKSTGSTKSTGYTRTTYAEIAANSALVLISVASSLLERQIQAQAKAFEKEGGFTERLYQRRIPARKNK